MAKKKRYHHGNLKHALIEAALTLIEEKGPLHFTLREAARLAGVAPSAPYRHFESKIALMTAIAEEGIRRLTATMVEEMKGCSEEPSERFQAMGIGFVKFAVQNPSHFRVMYIPEYNDPELSDGLKEAMAENYEQIFSLFGEMGETDSVSPFDPNLLFLTAQATTYGLARMFVDGQMARIGIGPEQVEDIARGVTNILGHGLAPRAENDLITQQLTQSGPGPVLQPLDEVFALHSDKKGCAEKTESGSE